MNYLDLQARSIQSRPTFNRFSGTGGGLLLFTIGLALASTLPAQPVQPRVPRTTSVMPARRGGADFRTLETPLATTANTDQGPGPGPIGPGPGCNLFPAPPSVGASVGLSYFGPAPSESNPQPGRAGTATEVG